MRTKIVHIISSLEVGGAQVVLRNIISHLPDSEHHVIYFHDDAYVAMLRACGASVHHLSGLRLYNPLFFIRLLRLVKKLQPDCVHTLLWAANVCGRLIAWLLKLPVVCVVHNKAQHHGTLREWIDNWTSRGRYQLVAVSQDVKQSLIVQHSCLRNKKIMVIGNGVDAQEVVQCARRANITRADVGLTNQHFIFGAVGRFESVKNFDLLLDCFAKIGGQYMQARLLLVGSGSQEHTLRLQARALGIEEKVVFVIGRQAYGYYPLFDCFVQSSTSEGVSIALLEAMSVGLPCIVTAEQKKHSVITHRYDGFSVPNNVLSLSSAMKTLLLDKALCLKLGKQSQETVCIKWSVHAMVYAYECIFKHAQNTK